ncbi:AEC family transporter [Litoreibacter sp.]|nr:AEC family transporter [Litoreibacter sp.]
MIHVLTQNILPVFAMLALGFTLGRISLVSNDEARTLNRIAFLVLQPPLILPLIAGIDLPSFDFGALGIYIACQAVTFTSATFAAKYIFKRDLAESVLLGMAMIFINSLLYIWPIATLIYGQENALPITAIVAWDASVTFTIFIVAMELITGKTPPAETAKRIALNPVLLSIVAGLILNASGIPIAQPILTAFGFAGAAAAPLTLFALGVILSGHPLIPSKIVTSFSAMKLIGFPLMVWWLMSVLLPDNNWSGLFTLTAAGPSGAMPFALALLYGVRSDAIAPIIIWTSALSLISLAYLA